MRFLEMTLDMKGSWLPHVLELSGIYDSALESISGLSSSPSHPLIIQIHEECASLRDRGYELGYQWIPSDVGIMVNRFIKEDQLPHLLFYGPPGTGKTSTILACAKQLYSPEQFSQMVLELNASDDRGIGIVRGQILSFASTRTIFKSGFKLIILDEADAMTNDAQNALRRIIEKFTENVRFCVICNYLSKIIPAVQSRCTRFRFGPLNADQILPRLEYVIEQENVSATEDGKKALLTLAQGDMRKVLNVLQSTSMAYKEVNEDNVYTCVGHPLKNDIANIVKWLLSDTFSATYNIEMPVEAKTGLLAAMSDIEFRLCKGTTEKAQLAALIAAFNKVRECVPDEEDV
uniref:AAA+ ATPase domain-containing protein n=2 Tax=Timema TaxID=61471 RepID=A0A7R9CIU5_TIMPO|nr:unnamed protein product [Timema douglasi]CAD7396583.1 unnamed protein product [Timema poppensis]